MKKEDKLHVPLMTYALKIDTSIVNESKECQDLRSGRVVTKDKRVVVPTTPF